MKKITISYLFILFSCFSFAQTFQGVYGGAANDVAESVQPTSDGGYIMAGYTFSYVAGADDAYLVKVNSAGAIQWTKSVGSSGYDPAYAVLQTTDGGYISAGYTNAYNPGNGDFFVNKFTSTGTLSWSRSCGGVSGTELAYAVDATSDGGYVVAGYTTGSGFGQGGEDFYIVHFNATGGYLWSATVGTTANEVAYSIQQTADGGYIVCGSTDASFGAGSYDVYLTKLTSTGALSWTKTFGGTGDDEGRSVQQTSDGGYIIGGYTYSYGAGSGDMFLIKVTSAGAVSWSRTFGGASGDFGYSVQQTADGGYVIGGYTNSFGGGSNDFYLVKTNVNGDWTWSRTYGGAGSEVGYSVQQTSDGGYVMGGYTSNSSWVNGSNDYYLVRTDANGNTPCNETMYPSTAQNNPSVTVNGGGAGTFPGSSNWGVSPSSNSGGVQNLLCPCNLSLSFISDNVVCYGQNNGDAYANQSGGVSPYTYSWSSGQTVQFITGLTAGNYNCTVYDKNGCNVSGSVNISQPGQLTAPIAKNNVSCNGVCDGTATINSTGGTTPYTYSWNTGATTSSISGLCGCAIATASYYVSSGTGTYTYNVSSGHFYDSGGSLGYYNNNENYTLTFKPATAGQYVSVYFNVFQTESNWDYLYVYNGPSTSSPLLGTYSGFVNPGAFTSTDPSGMLTFKFTSDNSNTYQGWNADIITSPTTSPSCKYSVTVTDNHSCSNASSVIITQPAVLATSVSTASVTCYGQTTGSATANPSGGTSPYSYSWQTTPVQTTQTATGLAGGMWQNVTVTDANGCTVNGSGYVNQPAAYSTTATPTAVTCSGLCNGSATISAAGGTVPYTYSWSNGATTTSISNLCGCTVSAQTYNVPSGSGSYTYNITSGHFYDSGGPNGNYNDGENYTITFYPAVGGQCVSVYFGSFQSENTYDGLSIYNGPSTASALIPSGLPVGNNPATCPANSFYNTLNPGLITSTDPSGALTFKFSSDGSVNFSGWSALIYSATCGTTPSCKYTVTVTDHNGCPKTSSILIAQPAVLTCSISPTNISCNGLNNGSATATASEGTAPYTYVWSNGQSVQTATGLSPVNYTVTVTDANLCSTTATVLITQPNVLNVVTAVTNTVSCKGGSNGSATATPSGGTTPYTYSWTSGATTSAASNLSGVNYTVTVTDNHGCTKTGTVSIAQPTNSVVASIAATNSITCSGLCNGTSTVTATGGTGAFTYSWSNGQSTSAATNLCAITYSATVTDHNGCSASTSTTVNQPSPLTASAIQTASVSCNGANTGISNNGSASVSAGGGMGAYTYSWSPSGGNSSAATGLSAGNYTVTVTDHNNCSQTSTVTIAAPGQLTVSQTHVDESCFGNSDAYVNLSVSGGTSPYTYSWTNSATTQNITGLGLGTYNVTVSDAHNCSAGLPNPYASGVPINQPGLLNANVTSTDATCGGTCNGSAFSVPTGGNAPFTYSWTGGATTSAVNNLCMGSYTLIVTDKNNCHTSPVKTIFSINEPTPLAITFSITPASCGASDGAASANVTGGNGTYTYNWSTNGTTSAISAVPAAVYTLTVTDGSGCTKVQTANVNSSSSLTTNPIKTDVLCYGASTGSINSNPSGGLAPYTFSWGGGQSTQSISGLNAGTYNITVTDKNNCVAVNSITINQPNAPLASSITPTNVTCHGLNNGIAQENPTGGTSPYTYLWTGGLTTQNLSNLSPAGYTVTITDSHNCSLVDSVRITEPLLLTAGISKTNATCAGACNGTATVTVSGGNTPYVYHWNDPNNQTTPIATGLCAGSYNLNVTDSKGCQTTPNTTIGEPTTLTISLSSVPNSCNNNGTATVVPAGGTLQYTYSWSTTPAQNSSTATGLSAGNYGITVTDNNGCVASGTVNVNSNPLSSSVSHNDVTCAGFNNGSVTLSISGGTTAYTFAWSNGASTQNITSLNGNTYSVLVTDARGCTQTQSATVNEPPALSVGVSKTDITCNGLCNGTATANISGGTVPYTYHWNPGNISATSITGLCVNNYSFILTDANGCQQSPTVAISQPNALGISMNSSAATCTNNGTASANVTGGVLPYTYSWTGGATTSAIANLSSGNYSVSVGDANGCTSTATVNVGSNPLSSSVLHTDENCFSGTTASVSITVSGGTTPYKYQWSNAETTQNLTGISAGTYSVLITDAQGCTQTQSATVIEPTLLTLTVTNTNISCNNACDGTALATISGGTIPYTYSWQTAPVKTTQAVSGLCPGNYNVNITDSKGCTVSSSTQITEPNLLTVSVSATPSTCGINGTATANVSGGTPPFIYNWSNNQTTAAISNLSAGNYSVTITDAHNCTAASTASVSANPLMATISANDISCHGMFNGSVALNVTGGTIPYTFSWSNAATTQNISNLGGPAANYSVLITDAGGCTQTYSATVNEPAILLLNISKTDITCNSLCNGTAMANVNGGNSPYVYVWQSLSQTTQLITGLCPGSYNLNINDSKGCVASSAVTISQPLPLTTTVSSSNAMCNHNDGSAAANSSGGTLPYTYLWSNGNSNQTANNIPAGNYSVTVTDANNCSASGSATVSVVAAAQAICIVSVDSTSSKNIIVWEKPSNSSTDSFRIYREISSVYSPIATVPYSFFSEYIDSTVGVNPNITSYKYKVSAIDSCGNESALSTYHHTMHLSTSKANPPASYNLAWNDYEGITVTQYVIMRDSAGTGWQAIDSVSFGNNSWTDIRTYPANDTISYYIRIDHSIGCSPSIKNPITFATNLNSSKSNVNRVDSSMVTNIYSIEEENLISIYPNPNFGLFTLQINNNDWSGAEARIYNSLGEEVKRMILPVQTKITQVDLRNCAMGVYHLEMRSRNKIMNKKIIIQ